jgi:membrane associated rhomboid family serine protease
MAAEVRGVLPKRNAHITKLIIMIWALIFLLDVSFFTKAPDLSDWAANILWRSHGKLNDLLVLVPVRVENHEYWRIISYAFTHFGLLHIVGNTLLISFIGNILETRMSPVGYILPLLLGDFLAGIGCMSFVGYEDAYINGSSPGIYALFGVFVSNLYFRKLNSSAYMFANVRNRIVIILLAANFLGVDTFVIHAIGFATGLLCGFIQVKCHRRFQEA